MSEHILNHLPDSLINKDTKRIADAENPEFDLTAERVQALLKNIYPTMADENGIEIFERFLDLTIDRSQSLEYRRAQVLAKFNQTLPYTELRLHQVLAALVGWEGFIYNRVEDYLSVTLTMETSNKLSAVVDLLESIVPLNIHFDVTQNYTAHNDLNITTHNRTTKIVETQWIDITKLDDVTAKEVVNYGFTGIPEININGEAYKPVESKNRILIAFTMIPEIEINQVT